MSTYVISLTQIKGGVAKTTTCINLGAALAEVGRSVLLVDLDPQGSLSSSFGFLMERTQNNISNVLFDNVPIKNVIQKTQIENLDIITSSLRLAKKEMAINLVDDHEKYQFSLRESIIELSEDRYDYIILDCPAFLGVITMNALMVSDMAIFPSTPDTLSLLGIKKMLGFLMFIKKNFNFGIRFRILITKYDEHKLFFKSLVDKLREIYGRRIFDTVINEDINISKSQLVQKPILSYQSSSKASDQYRALAQEIINYAEE